jgi:hypothetical protein
LIIFGEIKKLYKSKELSEISGCGTLANDTELAIDSLNLTEYSGFSPDLARPNCTLSN